MATIMHNKKPLIQLYIQLGTKLYQEQNFDIMSLPSPTSFNFKGMVSQVFYL